MTSSDDMPAPEDRSGAESASEQRYRTVFEHAPDAIVVFDVDTAKFVDANPNACRLFGLDHSGMLELGVAELSTEYQPGGEPSSILAASYLKAALDGATPVFEWMHQSAAGEPLSCEVRLVRMPPHTRRLVRGSITDIGERKAIEAEAARREREFRTLAEHSPDLISRVDRQLRRTYANPAVLAVYRTRIEDVLGKTPSESLPGSAAMSAWEDGLRAAIETGEPHVIDGLTDTEPPLFVQTSIVPEFDEHGEVESVLSVTRDLTTVKRSREMEGRLASIVDSSSEAIISSSLDGVITSWNKAAERLYGRTAEEAIGKTREWLTPESASEGPRQLRAEALAGGVIENVIREWVTHDGRAVTTSASFFPLHDSMGEVTGIASVSRDITAQRAASAALATSERRLRLALETARMGTWSYDEAADRMEFSPQAAQIYGRPPEEMPRNLRETLELHHPEDREATRRAVGAGEASGADPREYRVRLPDGSYRWLASVVSDGSGAFSGLVMDIHDRKLAEEALRASEESLRQVIESVSAGIFVFDGRSMVLVNSALAHLTGYSQEQLLEQGFFATFIGEPELETMRQHAVRRIRGEEAPRHYDVEITRADGEQRFWELQASRIVFRAAPCSIVSVFDVTDRKRGEDALRESESRFRGLVDRLPDYITLLNRDLRHEFVNATAEREAGLKPDRVIGQRIDELGFPPEQARLFIERHNQVIETGEYQEFEYEVNSLAHPNHVSWRRCRLIPETGDDGRVHHVLSVVTDITSERQAEAERRMLDRQMQHAQKLESLGVLAGGIAHDFNNLLVAILGNAGLALMELPPESPARQTLHAIETAAQHAAELTRQMLAYSGKGRFVIEPLNLSRIVEEMAHLLEVSISKRAVLKYRFAPELPLIEGDAAQVGQVIMNLILNASDAIGDREGVISISTGVQRADRAYFAGTYLDSDLPDGDYVFVEVADTGQGMDDETRTRIFDPFFTTKFTGRGLGLAAVLGIVRGHRGAIKLSSEVGRGTTFKVLFPPVEATTSPAPDPASAVPETSPSGETVLVIDDDDTVRAVTRRILEHSGFSVLLAADGRAGVDTYVANPGVALVLLDMTMPHMDGEETFRELRHADPEVRVLLTSGYNEQDATEHFAGKGLAGFIQKPYRPDELLAKINEALQR